ncbi:MAG: methionyl-tRNA formyltransferase [Chloroflexi bacterium]|nr:methionyl-tRNA formyltransferase [Chloroflexota bacterium]MYG90158.1 methionyl-tRNA formyltransferase [Chloroflexota bacterium]MYJ91604.1 methionyl-tRNA formyltransferase [Chloroflexota bacterium]
MPDAPRVLFYGSPDFALPTLRALIDSPYRPIAVVTQPDARAGRGRSLKPPPIKELAAEHGIPALQPARLRDPAAIAQIGSLKPDLQVVAAYGQIIPTEILDLPAHGTLNVHASLLPRWRGASPISAAILHGDAETGVTIMLVDETEDTGDILRQRVTVIDPAEHAGHLSDRLAELGAELLLETIPDWLEGSIAPVAQQHEQASRARRVKKQQGQIDWSSSALVIARQIRAYTPWPGASTHLGKTAIRITEAVVGEGEATESPGTIVSAGHHITVSAGTGVLDIVRIQRAGKRELSAEEFVRGTRDLIGRRFGTEDD